MDEIVLNNRYRLCAELGQGGMGVVYRAEDLLLGRAVAVKVLNKAGLGTEGRARLLREAQAIARLNHPNIVALYDAGEADKTPFIVMELLEGQSLFERRPSSADELVEIARQVCAALDHAHVHGIVHRDLKPENIIVTRPTPGDDLRVKLTDFGLARSGASRLSTEDSPVGTVYYLPPEQAMGQEIDGRADLYALGVVLYELASGRLPFGGDDPLTVISQHIHAPVVPPSTYNPDISKPLEALILRLMSKRPEDRPTSADAVEQILERIARKSTDLLLDPDAAAEPSPLGRLVRERLVGRDRELAAAKDVWRRAAIEPDAESEHVLLVSGESGVGKTPFVRALKALAGVSCGRELCAECYAEGSAPYAPLAQLVRAALDEPGLELELPPLVLADLVRLVPELRDRRPNLVQNPSLSPQAEQQRLFDSAVAACAALIAAGAPKGSAPASAATMAEAPLLLVIEDIHWADGGTLALLRHLARRSKASRLKLLIILTYREGAPTGSQMLDDVLLDFARERLAVRIRLTPFSRDETAALLEVMFQQPIPPSFVDGIHRVTEGNLFYIEEVCKALIEDDKVFCTDQGELRWHFPADMADIQIPSSILLAVMARVNKLGASTQEMLRLAAIIGREFDFSTLQRASGATEDELIEALEDAQRAQLVVESRAGNGRARAGEVFGFAHSLAVAALRESVSSLRRRRMHRRVAEAIQALRPDDDATLAYHYDQAGIQEAARRHYRRAGDDARAVYANEEAVAAYTAALALTPDDIGERFDLLQARAGAYDMLARRPEQRADIAALATLAEEMDDDGRRCDALLAEAERLVRTEHLGAQAPAQKAAELAAGIGDKVREGRALRILGYDARVRQDLAHSRSALEMAAERFQQAKLVAEAASCFHILSLTLGDLGRYDEALVAAQKALALSRKAGDRRQEAISLRRVAIVYLEQQRFEEALPFAEEALALHRDIGDLVEEGHALNFLGILHSWLGHPDECEAYLRSALATAETAGSAVGATMAIENLCYLHFGYRGEYVDCLALLEAQLAKPLLASDRYAVGRLQSHRAELLARLGQYARALEVAREVLASAERMASEGAISPIAQADMLSQVGRLEAEMGDHNAAREHLESALACAAQIEPPPGVAALCLNRVYGLLLEGEADGLQRALALAQRAIEILGKNPAWAVDAAEAHRLAAELRLALGENEAAHAAAAESLRLLGSVPYMVERNLFTYARALLATGRTAEAVEPLRRAYEQVLFVAERIADPVLRQSWLENVRRNREIVAEWEKLNKTGDA